MTRYFIFKIEALDARSDSSESDSESDEDDKDDKVDTDDEEDYLKSHSLANNSGNDVQSPPRFEQEETKEAGSATNKTETGVDGDSKPPHATDCGLEEQLIDGKDQMAHGNSNVTTRSVSLQESMMNTGRSNSLLDTVTEDERIALDESDMPRSPSGRKRAPVSVAHKDLTGEDQRIQVLPQKRKTKSSAKAMKESMFAVQSYRDATARNGTTENVASESSAQS